MYIDISPNIYNRYYTASYLPGDDSFLSYIVSLRVNRRFACMYDYSIEDNDRSN